MDKRLNGPHGDAISGRKVICSAFETETPSGTKLEAGVRQRRLPSSDWLSLRILGNLEPQRITTIMPTLLGTGALSQRICGIT